MLHVALWTCGTSRGVESCSDTLLRRDLFSQARRPLVPALSSVPSARQKRLVHLPLTKHPKAPSCLRTRLWEMQTFEHNAAAGLPVRPHCFVCTASVLKPTAELTRLSLRAGVSLRFCRAVRIVRIASNDALLRVQNRFVLFDGSPASCTSRVLRPSECPLDEC